MKRECLTRAIPFQRGSNLWNIYIYIDTYSLTNTGGAWDGVSFLDVSFCSRQLERIPKALIQCRYIQKKVMNFSRLMARPAGISRLESGRIRMYSNSHGLG